MNQLICPDLVIQAYTEGYFAMAEDRKGRIFWHSPDPRAIFPIYNIVPPRSIKQKLKKEKYTFKIDTQFDKVIQECANRDETWISEEIMDTYTQLHEIGLAHSLETYENGKLVGGLYGVSIGAAFFGESMFNKVNDAAKLAFYKLVDVLKNNNYILLDSQYLNPFTRQLGAIEVSRDVFMVILDNALKLDCKFSLNEKNS